MFPNVTQILKQLAVLVVCHGLVAAQISSRYIFVHIPMSWVEGREFCQSHYVDLAVLSSEHEYFELLNAVPKNSPSFWLGLHRKSNGWKWTSGEELSYKRWYNYNNEGCCVTLEAMWEKSDTLLARLCNEQHMIVCQGPVSPQSVAINSVGINNVNLSWNISAFMQMTAHYYNVTMCSFICETLFYPYNNGSSLMSINISNLTAATEYFIQVSAVIFHHASVTDRKLIVQDIPTTLKVRTATSNKIHKIFFTLLNLLSLVLLVPLFWFIYHVKKKDESTEKVQHRLSVEPLVQDFELLP